MSKQQDVRRTLIDIARYNDANPHAKIRGISMTVDWEDAFFHALARLYNHPVTPKDKRSRKGCIALAGDELVITFSETKAGMDFVAHLDSLFLEGPILILERK